MSDTYVPIIPEDAVVSMIYHLRNEKIMLDFDLAVLYQVETRMLKQAVKRNINRFPGDFMFQLNKEEWRELITNCDKFPDTIKHSPATPFAFTEQGVAMLSSILKSDRAIEVNIQIIRIFTRLRRAVTENSLLKNEIEKIKRRLNDHEEDIATVFRCLDELTHSDEIPEQPRTAIGFKPEGW